MEISNTLAKELKMKQQVVTSRRHRKQSKGVFRMKRSTQVLALGVSVFVLALVFTVGCGRDSNPLAPETHQITPLPIPPGSALAMLGGGMHDDEQMAGELITAAEGGIVVLDFCAVEIPAGALVEDVVISITHDDPHYAVFDMGPDGMQFAGPVMIKFNLDVYDQYMKDHGMEADDFIIALEDGDTGEWLPLYTIVVDDQGNTWAVAYTTHFSRYALAD